MVEWDFKRKIRGLRKQSCKILTAIRQLYLEYLGSHFNSTNDKNMGQVITSHGASVLHLETGHNISFLRQMVNKLM